MMNWLSKETALNRPRYRSLMEVIQSAIDDGRLKAGDRLPTHRDLAYELGLSVQTVSRAYTRLVEAGYIVGEVGRGSFVRNMKAETALPFPAHRAGTETIDLALLKPVVGDLHRDLMQATLRAVAQDMPDTILSSFRAATIAERHVEAVEHWLARCGVPFNEMAVIATNGNTPAMMVALMSASNGGDLVLTESMGHHTLPALCRELRLRLQGLAMDADGILPEAVEAACRAGKVKALYVAGRSGPVACTMSASRKKALVDLARQHDFALIENDACAALEDGASPPLAALAPERCFHFTSLTKCLVPGLRIGFLSVPLKAASAVRERHMVTNWMVTPLMHEIATRWIENGTAARLCDWQRDALGTRSEIASDSLREAGLRTSVSNLYGWLPCKDIGSEARLVERARVAGVLVSPGSTFSIGPLSSQPGIRLSLGVPDTMILRHALDVLKNVA